MIVLVLKGRDDPVELLRNTAGESVVVLIEADISATETAIARAAVKAVAIERAPHARINAIIAGSHVSDVERDDAIAFFHRSSAVTAQIIELA